MLDPIVLDNAAIDQAQQWLNTASRDWREGIDRIEVGTAMLISPVGDTGCRPVRLYLGSWQSINPRYPAPKGKTWPPRVNKQLPDDDLYNVVLNTIHPFGSQPAILAVLLHEIAHAVDPMFDTDCAMRRERIEKGLPELDHIAQYELPSEQRAFSAMCIEEIKHLRRRFPSSKGEDLIGPIAIQPGEFSAFVTYVMNKDDDSLYRQLKHHFNIIADSLGLEASTEVGPSGPPSSKIPPGW